MAAQGRPLKVIVKSPFSQYSGYGTDGFGIIRALHNWGCDVYPQPVWVDVPIPPDIAHLFTKTLIGPFDLLINHWDPGHLQITREARTMSRCAVAWTMWEFTGGPGPYYDDMACELRKQVPDITDEQIAEGGGQVVPGPVSGLIPHCERVFDTYNSDGESKQDGLASRLRWFDMVLGYDPVSVAALEPYIPGAVKSGVLMGGYDSKDWKVIDRDWHGDRFQFMTHGALNDRKAPWTLIEAFQKLKFEKGEAFKDASLALHTNAPGTLFPELNGPFESTRIKVYVDTFDAATLRDFYAAAHCYVMPSRGEGKNLPALEFGTTGGAVAITNYGGPSQYMSGDWGYPLEYRLQATFGDKPWAAHDARVQVDYLSEVLWHIYTHREEARQKGLRAAEILPKMCDWQVVIQKLFERIRDEVTSNNVGPQVYDAAMACRRHDEPEFAGRILL